MIDFKTFPKVCPSFSNTNVHDDSLSSVFSSWKCYGNFMKTVQTKWKQCAFAILYALFSIIHTHTRFILTTAIEGIFLVWWFLKTKQKCLQCDFVTLLECFECLRLTKFCSARSLHGAVYRFFWFSFKSQQIICHLMIANLDARVPNINDKSNWHQIKEEHILLQAEGIQLCSSI